MLKTSLVTCLAIIALFIFAPVAQAKVLSARYDGNAGSGKAKFKVTVAGKVSIKTSFRAATDGTHTFTSGGFIWCLSATSSYKSPRLKGVSRAWSMSTQVGLNAVIPGFKYKCMRGHRPRMGKVWVEVVGPNGRVSHALASDYI